MTSEIEQSSVFAALAAALCVLGLVLLAAQPRHAARVALYLGLGSVVWVGLWILAMPLVGALIAKRPPSEFGHWSFLAVNLAPALGTWIPAALLVWLTRARSAVRSGFATLCALFWSAGLVLPGLGQGGSWPVQSLGLLACCTLLAIAFGVLSQVGRTGAS